MQVALALSWEFQKVEECVVYLDLRLTYTEYLYSYQNHVQHAFLEPYKQPDAFKPLVTNATAIHLLIYQDTVSPLALNFP